MLVLLGLLEYPVFSTMLLMVAGILIGYAVCYPFRADTSGVTEKLEQVQQQNSVLQAALDDQRRAYARLEQQQNDQLCEWAQVRDSQLDLTTAWNQFGQNYSQVAAELKDMQKITDESAEMVKHERAERQMAEKALLAAEDRIDQLTKQLDEQERDSTKSAGLQARLDEAHAQIERLTEQVGNGATMVSAEADTWRTNFEQVSAELSERQNACKQLEEALASQARELKLAKEENVRLRDADSERSNLVGAIGARRKQVQQLEAERDEARANEHRIRRELERYKVSTLDRDRQLDRLRNMQNRFESETKEVEKLRIQNAELEAAANERDDLSQTVNRLTSERDAAVAAQQVAQTTMEKIEKQTRENRRLKERCDNALASLQREQLSRQTLESDLDESREELSTLRQRCLALQNADEECARLQAALEEGRRRLQQVTLERDAAFAAESASKDALSRLRQSAPSADDLDRLRQQREEVMAELETVRTDRERLHRAVRRQEEQITSLQALCCRLEATSKQNHGAETHSEHADELRRLSLEHELNSASLGQAEQTIDELRKLLENRQTIIEGLQRERDEALQKLSSSNENQIEPGTRMDSRLGLVYLHPPTNCNDLKLISGVNQDIEAKLNDLGIYTYQQIMSWTDLAVAEISKLLSCRDRIERENWVGQAQRLFINRQDRAA